MTPEPCHSCAAPRRSGLLRPALLAFALLCADMGGPAAAEPAGFTTAEQALIVRNASLRAAVNVSPAAVRQVLDTLAAARSGRAGLPAGEPRTEPDGGDFDPAADPDLSSLQRVSPEAAHDIFLVLKQVASTRPATLPK